MARNPQFRVDLGYEEMGFRSHLFFNEFETSAVGGFNSLSHNHRDPYASDVVDVLSDQFSLMSLLRPNPRRVPSLPSSFQSLKMNGHQTLYGGESLNLDPFYELHLSRLHKTESQKDRAKVLQRQEARLHKKCFVHRHGNVLRESVGTGVFHPLQRPENFNSVKKREQRNQKKVEKELVTKEKRRVMSNTSSIEQENKDECHYHLPSDMDFSNDWTF